MNYDSKFLDKETKAFDVGKLNDFINRFVSRFIFRRNPSSTYAWWMDENSNIKQGFNQNAQNEMIQEQLKPRKGNRPSSSEWFRDLALEIYSNLWQFTQFKNKKKPKDQGPRGPYRVGSKQHAINLTCQILSRYFPEIKYAKKDLFSLLERNSLIS